MLDERGLAVVGGRNSGVGVGGLTLGGKFLILFSMLIPPLQFRVGRFAEAIISTRC